MARGAPAPAWSRAPMPGVVPTQQRSDLPRQTDANPARVQGRKKEHEDASGGDVCQVPALGNRVAPALRPPAPAPTPATPSGIDAPTMAAIQAAVAAVTLLTAQITGLRVEVALIRSMEEDMLGDFGMEDVVAGDMHTVACSGNKSAFPRAIGAGAP